MYVVMYVGIAVDMIPSIDKYVHKYIYSMLFTGWEVRTGIIVSRQNIFPVRTNLNGKYLIYFFPCDALIHGNSSVRTTI